MAPAASNSCITGRHRAAGRWFAPAGAHFESHNPAKWAEVVGVFPSATAEEANQAVAAAREAFPGWRRTSRIRRAELFDNLAQIVKRETDNLAELFEEAGFPGGVINVVHGDGVAGEALVRNREVNVVLFTGSYEVGHRIQQLCAEHYDRICACEMGSKSAVIVCEDARLDLAVTCGVISAFKTSGQRCVSAGRILVAEKIFDRFADKFVPTAKRLRICDPLDDASFTGPVIHQAAVDKTERYSDLARREGGKVLLEGGRIKDNGRGDGCYL